MTNKLNNAGTKRVKQIEKFIAEHNHVQLVLGRDGDEEGEYIDIEKLDAADIFDYAREWVDAEYECWSESTCGNGPDSMTILALLVADNNDGIAIFQIATEMFIEYSVTMDRA